MAVDHIRYDILAQQALRGLVRDVLTDTAKKGLPGDHHFFITFNTTAEGVRLSPRLLEQYPEEMTVVLQHQFWDLKVTSDTFEVGLSFGGVAERLLVPFEAIKAFADPSVQFALQFETIEEDEDAAPAPETSADKPKAATTATTKPASKPAAKTKPPAPVEPAAGSVPAVPAPAAESPPAENDKGGAEVVRLDRFRKK